MLSAVYTENWFHRFCVKHACESIFRCKSTFSVVERNKNANRFHHLPAQQYKDMKQSFLISFIRLLFASFRLPAFFPYGKHNKYRFRIFAESLWLWKNRLNSAPKQSQHKQFTHKNTLSVEKCRNALFKGKCHHSQHVLSLFQRSHKKRVNWI